ncbi:TetR/AcrR family transcriptional regulator [Lacticaseibacillus brantae]|uniref:Transcriptional regulator, TetR family n=1 Tax=Lacticaseibacillus brantae DSM 23927 TaxID=1423727 RepID=A0A0R2B749_9LACO|nr:TetR/AcrR family transcriptional regulator [Lacticaseibacillus brantae]KRM72121.1 transcriptional regulator, TetR family [Lacticaseibacillus brantae DSM 23927]
MRPQDDEKRQRILDSTSEIIMSQGVAAVSLSKIAKAAGIASGTLYTYFADKDDMLRSLYLDRKQRLAKAITTIDVEGNPKQELSRFLDLVYAYGQEHLDDLLLIREFGQTAILRQLAIPQSEAMRGFESLEVFVNHGIAQHAFFATDYQALLNYAYAPVVEYLIDLQNGAYTSADVPFEQIKQLSLRAILLEEDHD